MNVEEVFLHDIIANTDDDTPRFVYADWLDDQGEEACAELIRFQCWLARIPVKEYQPEHRAMFRRTRELITGQQARLLGPLAHLLTKGGTMHPEQVLNFRRGLVEEVTLPLQAFVQHADELFARMPVRSVQIMPQMEFLRPPGPAAERQALEALAACPHLARLRSLGLAALSLTGEAMQGLAHSPYLTALTALSFIGMRWADEDLAVLADSPSIERLTTLKIHTCCGPTGLRRLVESNHLGPLTNLDLWGNQNLRAAGAAAVAGSPRLAGLTTLKLGLTGLDDEAAVALAGSPHLRKLTNLVLPHNPFGPDGMRALAQSPILGALAELNLMVNPLGPEGARALAASPHLSNLTNLCLHGCALASEGASALAGAVSLQRLEMVNLGKNEIGPEGAAALGRSVRLPNLVSLQLDDNAIGDEGAAALVASPLARQLRFLWLANNGMTSEGVEALARSASVPSLRYLALGNHSIELPAARALADSPHLHGDLTLHLQKCPLTPEVTELLRNRFGNRLLLR